MTLESIGTHGFVTVWTSMDDGPYWVILLMYESHDMRHKSFRRLTVVNGTPGLGRHNANLQKWRSDNGGLAASSMIKSTKICRERGRKFTQLELHTSPSWGILLIYRQWLPNLPPYLWKESPIFRDQYVFPYLGLTFPYQGLLLREIWDLETRKFMDKYHLRISHFYLFINNDLAMCGRMAD